MGKPVREGKTPRPGSFSDRLPGWTPGDSCPRGLWEVVEDTPQGFSACGAERAGIHAAPGGASSPTPWSSARRRAEQTPGARGSPAGAEGVKPG